MPYSIYSIVYVSFVFVLLVSHIFRSHTSDGARAWTQWSHARRVHVRPAIHTNGRGRLSAGRTSLLFYCKIIVLMCVDFWRASACVRSSSFVDVFFCCVCVASCWSFGSARRVTTSAALNAQHSPTYSTHMRPHARSSDI